MNRRIEHMTGKELIIYILENDLLDAEIFTSKRPGTIFITPEMAAFRWECGVATVKAMVEMNKVKGIKLNDGLNNINNYLIFSNQPNPFKKNERAD